MQKYIEEYTGCEPDPDGDFVKVDDVIALLEHIIDKLDPRGAAAEALVELKRVD